MKEFLEKIRSHTHDVINHLKQFGEWEIHLLIKPKFMSSRDSNEICMMYSNSDSSIVMIGNDTHKIIQELFYSFTEKYQISLEQSMKGRSFIFDYIWECIIYATR